MTTLSLERYPFETWKAERLLLWLWCAMSFPPLVMISLQALGNKYGFEPGDAFTGFFWLSANSSPILMLLSMRLSKRSRTPCNPTTLTLCLIVSVLIGLCMDILLFGEPWFNLDITDLMHQSYFVLLPLVGLLILLIHRLERPWRNLTFSTPRRAKLPTTTVGPTVNHEMQEMRPFRPRSGIEWIRQSDDGTCVIFIHGILSDAISAFSHANGNNWPLMLAEEQNLKASICTYSYRTDLLCEDYDLTKVVTHLREHFRFEKLWSKRKILFVVHSMGGIISRKFIVSNQTKLIKAGIEVGLLLVASPSLGSRDANKLMGLNRFLGNSQLDALRLADKNGWLADLDQEFFDLKEGRDLRIIGKELVENVAPPFKRYLLFRRPIVESWSAAPFFGKPCTIPYSDHSTISKPANRDADQHRHLLLLLQELQEPSDA